MFTAACDERERDLVDHAFAEALSIKIEASATGQEPGSRMENSRFGQSVL